MTRAANSDKAAYERCIPDRQRDKHRQNTRDEKSKKKKKEKKEADEEGKDAMF